MTEGARRYGFGAFAHRNFRLFFIGQGISLVGTWMQNVGEGWLILALTNSPFYVGLTAALSSVGVLLFSLYAGVIADRTDKRRVIILMQVAFMLEAFTVSILVWTAVIVSGCRCLLDWDCRYFVCPAWVGADRHRVDQLVGREGYP